MNLTDFLAERINAIEPSITLKISGLAKQMKNKGKDVIGFGAGEPDFNTPENIQDVAIKAIKDGKTRYTPASGIIELKEAVCEKLKCENGLEYNSENIVVSCGAKHSIYNVIMAIINPGDEMIVPTPYWVSYPDMVSLAGGKTVFIETNDITSFKITPAQLEQAITPKTKLLMLNSPSNPTGMVYSEAELIELSKVILKHDLLVISDEIYEKLVYEGVKHISIASLNPEIKNRTIVVNGASKAYAMTGWRIGYIAAPTTIANAVSKLQSHSTSNPTTSSQWATVEAITGSQEKITDMCVEFNNRRKLMVALLNNIEGFTCLEPDGAFYAFPKIASFFGKTSAGGVKIKNSLDFCSALLDEALVACIPGSGFGADEYMRLSYATSEAAIKSGITRIADWVKTLK